MEKINLEDLSRVAKKLGFGKQMEYLQFLTTEKLRGVTFIPTERRMSQIFTEETIERTKKIWEKHRQEVLGAFPGDVASVSHLQVENGIAKIFFERSTFDYYIGTKRRKLRILSEEPFNTNICLPISMGAITITSDNDIIVGIRGNKVSITKWKAVPLPSGFLDPNKHIICGEPSLASLILSELKEELMINWFTESEILGIIHETRDIQQPMITVRLKVPFTSEEIRQRLEGTEMEETDEIIFVGNNIEAIKSSELNWTLDSVAKFVLHFAIR